MKRKTHTVKENYITITKRTTRYENENGERGKSNTKYEILLKSVYQHHVVSNRSEEIWILDSEMQGNRILEPVPKRGTGPS